MSMSRVPKGKPDAPAISEQWQVRLILFLLLFTVPFLTTAAKNSWYLPKSNQAHYLAPASKLKVAHAPVIQEAQTLPSLAQFTLPVPQFRATWPEAPAPTIPSVGLSLPLQPRSPPLQLGS